MKVEDLRVTIAGKSIVDGVDLVARQGELLALVGPNGAGKSTLLAAIAGDLPHQGSVLIDGREPSSYRAVELARLRSVLPQHTTLSFPFRVRDIVEMGRAPWAGTPEEKHDEEVVRDSMERAGVVEFADRRFPSLSGGERARVSLARVLAQRTPLLLLDEPTAALDLKHQELVLAVARRRAAEGCAVVVVLHDLGLAAAHADQAVVLRGGRVAASGSPVEVFTPELLSEVYEHPVDVIPHPETGVPLVVPARAV
ncbi:heme ABC transporter ATP-binding protein [Allokutzneria sp. NRRL B-24872]|uniref:heme ABC transporter ATP-binding protein n=1 Tax=Allokutzneria sp. NRRL B-24872 TaxID=1137961 RepID=UPI001FF061CB|nr:heme ABC transporter ATP-binding protein [Allokutzneria sp. NRRL B-24872]